MMKYWLALLVLLNALVLAWQLDAFAPWGFGPHLDREPERLEQQIKPEALQFEAVPSKPMAESDEAIAPDAQLSPAADLSPDNAAGFVGAGSSDAADPTAQEAPGGEEGNNLTNTAPSGGSDVTPAVPPTSPTSLAPAISAKVAKSTKTARPATP
jgi:hypothetical protein